MNTLDPQQVIDEYLSHMHIMQLATVRDSQPWVCSLHFVALDNAIYWISKDDARHSKDITAHAAAAMTIAISTEKPLVGLQAEGTAQRVTSKKLRKIVMQKYVTVHGTDQSFADTVVDGKNVHKVYQFHPTHFVLFDQSRFPDDPVQDVVIKK